MWFKILIIIINYNLIYEVFSMSKYLNDNSKIILLFFNVRKLYKKIQFSYYVITHYQ